MARLFVDPGADCSLVGIQGRDEPVDEERQVFRLEHRDTERFDRIAFAIRVLGVLDPSRMSVAVYRSTLDLHMEHGRDLAGGPDAGWAIVGIPPHASRRTIAYALAELAGQESVPFLVDVLVQSASRRVD